MQERVEPSSVVSSRRGWKSLLSLGIAALACPCHLPLVVGLLAGTTFGAWISQHNFAVTMGMLGVFVVSLIYGLRALNRQPIAGDATDSESLANSIPHREQETSTVGRLQRP